MAQIKNKKINTNSRKAAYSQPNGAEGCGGFHCTWQTFWIVLLGIIGMLLAAYPICNAIINAKIKPVYREVDLCKEKILNTNALIDDNEKKRDEKILLQIQIIEQKIQLHNKKL